MRVKEYIQKTQEKKNQLDWSFAEWLDHFSKEPTSKELDDMEKRSANNTNYQPLRGA